MKPQSGYLLLTAVALAAAAPLALGDPGSPDRSYYQHNFPPGSRALPFSDAVRSGNTLYVAGHIGIDPKPATRRRVPRPRRAW